MKTLLQKLFLIVTLLSLVLLAFPTQSAYAAGPNDPPIPEAIPDPERAKTRLEWSFANQKLTVQRIGLNLEYQDEFIARIEELVAKAKENGKDVSAIEAALADYKKALEASKPLYEQAVKLVQTHEGFDANGKVTDLEKARETVKQLGETLKQHREVMGEAAKALHEALKAFREANPRPAKP
jgi:hypothetical protein